VIDLRLVGSEICIIYIIYPVKIAMLYFKRWSIEKTFNNSKSDFKERKAWSPQQKSLNHFKCRFPVEKHHSTREYSFSGSLNKNNFHSGIVKLRG
jgi:hypothetical protein